MREILRKVVTDKEGTASLANIFGYEVSGKTGTSEYYKNEKKYKYVYFFFLHQSKKIRFISHVG